MRRCFHRIHERVGHQTQARSDRSRYTTQISHAKAKPPAQRRITFTTETAATHSAGTAEFHQVDDYSSSSSAACSACPCAAAAAAGAFAFFMVQYPTNNITINE